MFQRLLMLKLLLSSMSLCLIAIEMLFWSYGNIQGGKPFPPPEWRCPKTILSTLRQNAHALEKYLKLWHRDIQRANFLLYCILVNPDKHFPVSLWLLIRDPVRPICVPVAARAAVRRWSSCSPHLSARTSHRRCYPCSPVLGCRRGQCFPADRW